MRARVGIGLFIATSVAAASLSAAVTADTGAGATSALSDTRFADVSTAPGSQVTLAGGEDGDGPIRTGRWAEDRPQVQLAGGPPAPASTPNSTVIRLASAPPQSDAPTASMAPAPITLAALAPPSARLGLQQSVRPIRTSSPRIMLSLGVPTGVNPGSGLAMDRDSFDNLAAPRIARPQPKSQIRGLLVQLQAKQDRNRGRWFIFAAGSGEAYGFNLIKDPIAGWKKSGWSVERLAEFGKAQVGIGWRKGRAQIAATAARREIGAYGISREDTVFGLTFSLSGAKPTPRPRGGIGLQPTMQRRR